MAKPGPRAAGATKMTRKVTVALTPELFDRVEAVRATIEAAVPHHLTVDFTDALRIALSRGLSLFEGKAEARRQP
jgi:hypothetical protein